MTVPGEVSAFTFAAPPGTPDGGGVEIGGPVATFGTLSPAGAPDGGAPFDGVTVALYDETGLIPVCALPNARAVQWQDELSKAGTGSFEVPLTDTATASIVDRSIVKFTWLRAGVPNGTFAVRIQSEGTQLAVDGRRWLQFTAQPGVFSLLGDATVYPEYGLTRRSPSSRAFGYMSDNGSWRVASEWVTPRAAQWGMVGGRHGHVPVDFTSADDWIAASSPNTGVPADAVNYFRGRFVLTDPVNATLLAAGDNFLEVYIDGEQIIAPDKSNYFGWRTASSVPVPLEAGAHIIAAKVANSVPIPLYASNPNPVGFICRLFAVDATGNPGSLIIQSDTARWVVDDGTPQPGWHRAQVLRKLVLEAQARSVLGTAALSIGFTDSRDSSGVAWTDRGQFIFDVATVNLADVTTQLCESEMDAGVDPVTMTLNAWVRRGADRSGSVALTLGDAGGNLKSYETNSAAAKFTAVVTQLADGTYLETTFDPGGIGRIETGLSLGSASATGTAADMALAQLAESSQAQTTVTAEPSTLTGAVAYLDYGLGDSITVPGRRNVGTLKARVLAITVDATGETVRAWPELVASDE